ncbi:MAG: PorT family protein [Bacteroidales bacterium]|jgi:hypothetical protein|nr:PorT family protein [Bacteroidales bacterium]
MKAIKLLVIAAVMALATPAFSQELSFGAKVGLNLSSATIKSGGEKADDIKMLPGLNVGVFADMNFSELLALEAGLQYEQKGYKFTYKEQGEELKDKYAIQYLTIPVNLRANLAMGDNTLYFLAGPTFGLGLSAKETVEYNGEKESESAKFGNGEEDDIKRMNVGLLFGAGFDLSSNLGFRVTYDLGLSNLVPKGDSDNKCTTGVIGVALTFKF